MGIDIDIRSVTPGYTWSVYFGCSESRTGAVRRGTADHVVSGWAATREQAKTDAKHALQS